MATYDRDYQELELTFENGQITSIESSILPDGAVSLLENWVPEETGGVRVREGWKKSSTTGGPATVRGLGATGHSVTRTPNYRQKVVTQGTTVSGGVNPKTITINWDQATQAGNTLLVKVSIRLRDVSSYYIPTSFGGYGMLIPPQAAAGTSGQMHFWLVKEDAASESTISLTFECDTATDELIWLAEATELMSIDTSAAPKNLLDCTASMTTWRRNDGMTGIKVLPGWQNDLNVVTANMGPGDAGVPYDNVSSGTPASGLMYIQVSIPITTLIKFGTLGGTSGAPVVGNTQYTASLWAGFSAASGQNARLNILWYDSGGALISTSNGTITQLVAAYFRYTVTATSPSNAVFAKVQFETTSTIGTLQQAKLSGAQLELGAAATSWVHGQISSIDRYSVGEDASSPVNLSTSDSSVPVSWSEASVYMAAHAAAASGIWGSYTETSDQERIDVAAERVWMTSAYKVLTVTITQTDDVTVTNFLISGPWIIGNFKVAAAAADTDVFYVAAQNDTTDLDIYYIDQADIVAGSWTLLAAGLTAGTGGSPVAFASGLGYLLVTHPSLTKSKIWQGSGFALVDIASGAYGGSTCAFFKSRFFIGGVNASPTRLYYSDIGSVTSWPAANYLEVGQADGYPISDIEVQTTNLIIGKGNSIWVLSGAGPDTFYLIEMDAGDAAPGRSITSTPYGAIVAGLTDVWQIIGSSVESISENLGASYAPTGYVFTAYIDDHLYILDVAGSQVFVCNLKSKTWHIEKFTSANNQLVFLGDDRHGRLIAQPTASTDTGLLMYRNLPSLTRTRDFSPLTSSAKLDTGQLWPVGPRQKITPRWLFLQIRQRGTSTQDVTLTPYYDATTGSVWTINNKTTEQVWRERIDLAEYKGVSSVRFVIEGPSSGNQFDIEQATLGYYVEEIR